MARKKERQEAARRAREERAAREAAEEAAAARGAADAGCVPPAAAAAAPGTSSSRSFSGAADEQSESYNRASKPSAGLAPVAVSETTFSQDGSSGAAAMQTLPNQIESPKAAAAAAQRRTVSPSRLRASGGSPVAGSSATAAGAAVRTSQKGAGALTEFTDLVRASQQSVESGLAGGGGSSTS